MRTLKRAGVAVGLLTSWFHCGVCSAQPGGGGPPPAKVVLADVVIEPVALLREVTGSLRAARRSTLSVQDEGLVLEVLVEAGDGVTAGQPIARMDDRLAELEVARAQAQLLTRQAAVREHESTLGKAKRDEQNLRGSMERQGATEREVQDALSTVEGEQARLEQAKADVAWAEADLERARKRLHDMTISAPFAGRITSKQTEAGQWLALGDPVVELIQMNVIDAWLDVPERFIEAISSAGAAVQIRVSATGVVLSAPVAGIVPDADPVSRLFPVRVRLENKNEALRAGMSVIGLVPTGQVQDGLTVPKDALLRSDVGMYVYFNAGGTAQVASVQPLFAFGAKMVVRSDTLKAGMQVIVEGNERIMFPGQPLAPVPPAPPAPEPVGGGGRELEPRKGSPLPKPPAPPAVKSPAKPSDEGAAPAAADNPARSPS
ncbi:MAG: efflux RND transporter periplasmic adaptor subunit [Phycisphaerales bacterium]|nr:efflux RND transporter periplasmic adaptor subunit [Phycisphaerales bacterium]